MSKKSRAQRQINAYARHLQWEFRVEDFLARFGIPSPWRNQPGYLRPVEDRRYPLLKKLGWPRSVSVEETHP